MRRRSLHLFRTHRDCARRLLQAEMRRGCGTSSLQLTQFHGAKCSLTDTHTHKPVWTAILESSLRHPYFAFVPECGAANQRQPPIELHSILMMPDWQFESDAVWSVTVQGGCGLIEKCCSHQAGNSISARHFYFCLSLKQPQFIQPADPSTHTETGYTHNYLYG